MFLKDLVSANAVKIGSLYFKADAVESRLMKTVRMVMFGAENAENLLSWPFGRSGSCTLLKYMGYPLVITTRHELRIGRGRDPSEIDVKGILFPSLVDKLGFIPVDTVIFDKEKIEEEFHDVLIFKVFKEWEMYSVEFPNFFQINPFPKLVRVASFAIGHLTSNPSLDYENEKIDFTTSIFECSFDDEFRSNNMYYRRYFYKNKNLQLDGLSGGAVYSLIENNDGFEILFDGIIVRAGSGNLHIVDGDFILRLAQLSIK